MNDIMTSKNRVVVNPLEITYTEEERNGYYLLTRRATKRYYYTDMTLFGADIAVKTLVAKYTREFSVVKETSSGTTWANVKNLPSEIYYERESPVSYRVVVNADETDERVSVQAVQDVAAFFADIVRDYDEASTGVPVVLNGATFDPVNQVWRVSATYNIDVETVIQQQYKSSETGEWQHVGRLTVPAGTHETSSFSISAVSFPDARFVHVVSGLFESNTIAL